MTFRYTLDVERIKRSRWSHHLTNAIWFVEIVVDKTDFLASPTGNAAVDSTGRQLAEWNNTQSPFPDESCIHELFEAEVERTPNARALVFGERSISYQELNERANQLAHCLRRYGAGPDVLVGLFVERSLDSLIALLGILKAGSAYVPLDPAYPAQRLTFILADSNVNLLVTQEAVRHRLPKTKSRVISLDGGWDHIVKEPVTSPVMGATAENLAYVIYTSGSTGRPKGVAMSHRPVCNLTTWQKQRSAMGAGAKTLQLASLSFDVSVQEIFSTLCTGGILVLIPEELRRDPKALLRLITSRSIERIFLPFSSLQQLADAALREGMVPTSLREIMTAGEQLRITPQIEGMLRQLDECTLYNQYGPTETHVVMSFYPLKGTPQDWPKLPPIGRPIANTQMYVLDEHRQPLPIGAIGELYIGGACLARGYLNQPELTAERFIADSFSECPGARLYRSGDLARYLPDGNLEFVGRVDDQVKVRGYRIELGEVESALSQNANVRRTAVAVREGTDGEKRLVAYIVPKTKWSASPSELREFLQEWLPDYMIPSLFISLDSLPLTPSGKVDRKALPEPETARPTLNNKFRRTQTPIEEALAEIWAEVLELDQVGVNDKFFDLGGDSLKATRVLARIEARLGVEISHKTSFEAPTIAELAALINVAQQKPVSVNPEFPSTEGPEHSTPLSLAQEGLWIATQLQRDEPIYNESFTIYINECVDVPALERALNKFVERHESLRTGFVTTDGGIAQQAQKTARLQLRFIDLRTTAEGERATAFATRASKEARHPFDLRQPPLVRATLFRLGESEFRLYLVFHHLIADAYSVYEILLPELHALYRQISHEKPLGLPTPSCRYADYVQLDRDYLKSEAVEQDRAYWERQLASITPMGLPTDLPRPPICTFHGRFERFSISKKLSDSLADLSQSQGVTLYMLLLAAFNVFLWRYTGQDDVAIGTVKSNRHRPEFESIFGFFINTLIIRAHLADNPRFVDLLARVAQSALDAYGHDRYPLGKLVERFQTSKDPSRHPLFQVAFVMEPSLAVDETAWTISQLDVQDGTSKFDLTLEVEARNEGIIGRFEYSTDLFERATIVRMIGHFQTLLESIVESPERRLSDLPLLTGPEKQQLLVDWNDTAAPYPSEKCIDDLFQEQVARTPNAVAVIDEERALTYHELNARANQMAHYLRAKGVGSNVFVGLCMHRSVDLVAAMLGTLKAGGAYVPLDSDYPEQRLAFMVEDAQLPVIITQQSLLDRLPPLTGELFCLDRCREHIERESIHDLVGETGPENTAYVIYTSGSSGKPKGVQVSHRAVNRLVCGTDYVSLDASDCVAQVSSTSFDAATFEIWGALLNGARLVIIGKETLLLAEQFSQRIRSHGVNTLFLTTALFNLFSRTRSDIFGEMRNVLFGGEVADPGAVAHVLRTHPPERLLHVYGPTETTTFATWYEVEQCAEEDLSIPIGRPIANTQLFVLDKYLSPTPVGVPGELYIAGDGVAQGYLNRPELTEERFIPNPFSDDQEARLYKTGDRVRYLPDGNLEFLERQDHQIKLRGYRIELGEIEALLTQCAGIQEAVACLREDIDGDKRLVAYVVAQRITRPTENELRNFLKAKLPDYMMPSAFVFLDRLPLTANEKVDRGALPAPGEHENQDSRIHAVPRNVVEVQLKHLWEQLLGVSAIGLDDNFFDLGGHSLLAVQLMGRIKQLFDRDLPLDVLWHGRGTIRCLAQMLLEDSAEPIWSRPVAIRPGGKKLPLFCLPVAGGHLFNYFDLSAFIDPDRPVYGLPSVGADGRRPALTSIEAIAAHSIEQMRDIQSKGPYHLAGYCSGGVIAFEMALQLQAQGEEVAFLGLIDSLPPSIGSTFRLMLKDLLRGRHLRLVQERLYVLVLNALRLPRLRQLEGIGESHRWALWTYKPRPFAGRITLFRPIDYEYSKDATLGWGPLARGGVEVHALPGKHTDLTNKAGSRGLAEQLNQCLDSASRCQVKE